MEEQVIRGAIKLIQKSQPIIYTENDRFEKSKSLVLTLLELGYRLRWHIVRIYSPDNFFKNKENVFGEVSCYNMVCARQARAMFRGLVETKSSNDPHPLAPYSARIS
jgi:hypothetical protein